LGHAQRGSAELDKMRGYMIRAIEVVWLECYDPTNFTPTTPIGDRKMVNVTAELPGESNDVIIISSHYDTKYFKDLKFVGANDGGASTGALMEIARVLGPENRNQKWTYWFVFFDGEEAFWF